MNIKLDINRFPEENEYAEQKSIDIGNDTFYYWVNKKSDDPNYEEINSELGNGLSAIIGLNKDNRNIQQSFIKSQLSNNTSNIQFSKQNSQLQQALIKSQQELMNTKIELKNMQQMIIKAQLSNINNGGNNNEQLSK